MKVNRTRFTSAAGEENTGQASGAVLDHKMGIKMQVKSDTAEGGK